MENSGDSGPPAGPFIIADPNGTDGSHNVLGVGVTVDSPEAAKKRIEALLSADDCNPCICNGATLPVMTVESFPVARKALSFSNLCTATISIQSGHVTLTANEKEPAN